MICPFVRPNDSPSEMHRWWKFCSPNWRIVLKSSALVLFCVELVGETLQPAAIWKKNQSFPNLWKVRFCCFKCSRCQSEVDQNSTRVSLFAWRLKNVLNWELVSQIKFNILPFKDFGNNSFFACKIIQVTGLQRLQFLLLCLLFF